jgi:hypothetical protein
VSFMLKNNFVILYSCTYKRVVSAMRLFTFTYQMRVMENRTYKSLNYNINPETREKVLILWCVLLHRNSVRDEKLTHCRYIIPVPVPYLRNDFIKGIFFGIDTVSSVRFHCVIGCWD